MAMMFIELFFMLLYVGFISIENSFILLQGDCWL